MERLLLNKCFRIWLRENNPLFGLGMRKIVYFGIICIQAVLLFSSCSPERILARKYIGLSKGNGVMIVPSYELFKDNLTLSFDSTIQYSQTQFDSIAWEQSCFIQHVSDSEFLTRFTNSMIAELTASGFDVYVDGSSDVFLSLPDPKWMVQIAQLELNEAHRSELYYVFSLENIEHPSYESFRVNKIDLSSWLEVSRTNAGNKQVLFLEGYIEDDLKNALEFKMNEDATALFKTKDSLSVHDVYVMADDMGRKHAGFLFDYFMNEYIGENLPEGIINRKYFHFDRLNNSLKKQGDERFEVIDQ